MESSNPSFRQNAKSPQFLFLASEGLKIWLSFSKLTFEFVFIGARSCEHFYLSHFLILKDCSVHQITFWSANFTLQPVMIVVLMVMLRCPILQRNEAYSVLQRDYLFLGNTLGPSESCCLRCKARVEIRNGNNNLKSKQKHSSRRDYFHTFLSWELLPWYFMGKCESEPTSHSLLHNSALSSVLLFALQHFPLSNIFASLC